MEADVARPEGADRLLVHRAKVVASITAAAAALEAMINEAFSDAVEQDGSCVQAAPESARKMMAELWSRGIPCTASYPILEKFDIAHLLILGVGLDKADHRWRNARHVTALRNHFVHFEPEWSQHGLADEEEDPTAKTKNAGANRFKKLDGLFELNPFMQPANPFYPDKILGHGCAEWSFGAALAFADWFWDAIHVVPGYYAYRSVFQTR